MTWTTQDAPWWTRGRRLPDLPAQLRRLERRRHRRPARASLGRLDYLGRLGVDVLWLSPIYRVAAGRQRLRHQRLPGHRPGVRHARRLRRAARGGARPRHEAGHGPGRQPHLRRAPVVRRVAVEPRQPEARLVLVAPGPRRYASPARRAPSRPTGARSSPGPAWEFDEATGEYYLHLFCRKQPDLNWENPRGPRRRLRDDALVARPGRRRLPHGRHQPASRRTRPCPTAWCARAAVLGDGWPHFVCGPRIHEFLAEMHREVFAGPARPACSPSARCPASPSTRRVLFTDPARREVDMVFQFEHVGLDHGAGKCDVRPLDLARAQGVVRPVAGRPGRRRLEQPVLGQPRPAAGRCRGSATTAPSTGCASAKVLAHRAAPAPGHAVRVPGRGAGHDERAVRRRSTTSATSSRSNHYRHARRRGRRPGRGAAPAMQPMSRDNARTPDAVGRLAARRVHDRRARGSPSTPTTPTINAAAERWPTPTRCSTTTGGSSSCGTTEPVVAARRLHDAAARPRAVYAFTRRLDDVTLTVLGNFSGEVQEIGLDLGELVLGNYPDPSGPALRPWEARVHRS